MNESERDGAGRMAWPVAALLIVAVSIAMWWAVGALIARLLG